MFLSFLLWLLGIVCISFLLLSLSAPTFLRWYLMPVIIIASKFIMLVKSYAVWCSLPVVLLCGCWWVLCWKTYTFPLCNLSILLKCLVGKHKKDNKLMKTEEVNSSFIWCFDAVTSFWVFHYLLHCHYLKYIPCYLIFLIILKYQ